MRVAVAEDNDLFRSGIEALLSGLGMEVVACVDNGESLLAAVSGGAPPDVVVVDMRMPPTRTNEGLLVVRALRAAHPDVGVLVLSADDDAPYVAELFAGAPLRTGYLYKGSITDRSSLGQALGRLRAGRPVLDRESATSLLLHAEARRRLPARTAKEREAVLLVLQDHRTSAIAERTGMSERDVGQLLSAVTGRFGGSGDDRLAAFLAYLTG